MLAGMAKDGLCKKETGEQDREKGRQQATWMCVGGISNLGRDSMFKGPEAEACLVLQRTEQRSAWLEQRNTRPLVGGPGGLCQDHGFYLGRYRRVLEGLGREALIWNSGDLGTSLTFAPNGLYYQVI